MEDKTFELLTKMYSDFTEFKNSINEKVDDLTGEVKNTKESVNKNTISLEDIYNKLQTMAEVQQSHYEQNQRNHQEIVELLGSKITNVENTVNNTNIKAIK